MSKLVIHKFPIPDNSSNNRFTIISHQGFRPLCAQTQRGQACIWAEVDIESKPNCEHKFAVIGTGVRFDEHHEGEGLSLGERSTYIGTIQEYGGDLIWHIYYMWL